MGWVTLKDKDGVVHHVLLDEDENKQMPSGNRRVRARAQIQYPSNEAERRLTVTIFNETSGLVPDTTAGRGSAADLHAARVAVAEIAKRAAENGHPDWVAPDELSTGLWQGLNNGNANSISNWNDSLSAARAALKGSDTTQGAIHFRLDAKSGTIPDWARAQTPSKVFGPFGNGGGGDASRSPKIYVYRH